jgi:hypothetical protein
MLQILEPVTKPDNLHLYNAEDFDLFRSYDPFFEVSSHTDDSWSGFRSFDPYTFPPEGDFTTCKSHIRYNTRDPASISNRASFESASCCDSMLSKWSRESLEYDYRQTAGLYSFWPVSDVGLSVFSTASCDGPFTTLCDGWPRAMCSPTSKQLATRTYPQTSVSQSCSYIPTSVKPFPIPRPSCSVASSDCKALWDFFVTDRLEYETARRIVYSSQLTEYRKNKEPGDYQLVMNPEQTEIHRPGEWNVVSIPIPYIPNCSRPEYSRCRIPCRFFVSPVDIMYFPTHPDDDEVSKHLTCSKNETNTVSRYQRLPTALDGATRTAIWNGKTLTSPYIYAHFNWMKHANGCDKNFATNILFSFHPSDGLSRVLTAQNRLPETRDGIRHYRKPIATTYRSLDLVDIATSTVGNMSFPLIPWLSYYGDNRCDTMKAPCETIFHDYQPLIRLTILPEELKSINPLWEQCGTVPIIVHDPLTALTPMNLDVVPTPTINGGYSPTAEVGVTLELPTPKITIPPSSPFPAELGAGEIDDHGRDGIGTIIQEAPSSKAVPNIIFDPITVLVSTTLVSVHDSNPGQQPVGHSDVDNGQQQSQLRHIDDLITQTQAALMISGHYITATQLSQGVFVINDSTFSSGGSPVTINNVEFSALTSGVVANVPRTQNGGEQSQSLIPITTNSQHSSKSSGVEGEDSGEVTGIEEPTSTRRKKNDGSKIDNCIRFWEYSFVLILGFLL